MARLIPPRLTPQRPKITPSPEVAVPIAGGTLRIHELRSRIFGNTRLLRVWLPPGYDQGRGMRHPVLYLNDGQNLFEPATAFAGVHWQVGETASRLIGEKKIPPLIIVGIDNAGKNRAREYLPYKSRDPNVPVVKGTLYPKFLRRDVMPLDRGAVRRPHRRQEYGIRRLFAWRADHSVYATGRAGDIWATADRKPIVVRGESKNPYGMPQVSRMAVPLVSRHGNA